MPAESWTTPGGAELVEQARAAVECSDWSAGCSALAAADERGLLNEPGDLESLAVCAHLTGRPDLADAAWSRAFEAFCAQGNVRAAVRCAFWLGIVLVTARGAKARGSGWIARAHRLLDERGPADCPEWGYLLLPGALQALDSGDAAVAYTAFEGAASIGQRFGHPDLVALGRLGQGQALIRLGEPTQGAALLDESMLAVASGEVSPLSSGLIYCAVLIACQQTFDVGRAQEWTEAFSRWCDAQPGLVPFRGQCLVHRSQLAQLRGDWPRAVMEADRACRWLSDPPDAAAGMAWYQRGELHRLQGELADAEVAYRAAAERGHDPHPGLALLWLAQARTSAAVAAIRRVVDETPRSHAAVSDELQGPRARAESLAAYVDIMLRGGDVQAAETACAELAAVADALDTQLIRAMAAHAQGHLLLVTGHPGAALERLEAARSCWMRLQAPYEMARTRLLASRALQQLGDQETASIELAAANRVLAGARTKGGDLEDGPTSGRPAPDVATALTARELEVIRLVAAGRTNREIGEELVISDKTVARHLHNVLTKLGLRNRSAATAFACRHGLV